MTNFMVDDSHTHWADARMEAMMTPEYVAELGRMGLRHAVVCGTRREDWMAVSRLAERFPHIVVPGFGVHPWSVGRQLEDWLEQLESWLKRYKNAVVGEIGLDYYAAGEGQEQIFLKQWELACRLNRVVEVHCVGAWQELQSILKDKPVPQAGWLLHAFTGSIETARYWLARGAYFSFNIGMVRANNLARVSDLYRELPIGRILIETDAPNQSPQVEYAAYPGIRQGGATLNDPRNLWGALRMLAGWRGCSPAELAAQLKVNFDRLFAGSLR